MRSATKYWSSNGVDLFGEDGADEVRLGSDGCTVRLDGSLEWHMRAEVIFDVEKTTGNSQRTSLEAAMAGRDQLEPWRSNVMFCRCRGSRSRMRTKLVCWLSLKHSRNSRRGVFGGDGVSIKEAASPVTGMLSCMVWASAMGGSVADPWKRRGG